MSYVSFKIDVSPDDFAALADVNIWPINVNVREFVRMTPPRPTLGQFLPRSSPNNSSPEHQSKVAKVDQRIEDLPSNNDATAMETEATQSSPKNVTA